MIPEESGRLLDHHAADIMCNNVRSGEFRNENGVQKSETGAKDFQNETES